MWRALCQSTAYHAARHAGCSTLRQWQGGRNKRRGGAPTSWAVGAADAQQAHGRHVDGQVEQVHGDAGGGDGAQRAQRDRRARGRRAADLHPGHARQQARAQHAHRLPVPVHQPGQACTQQSMLKPTSPDPANPEECMRLHWADQAWGLPSLQHFSSCLRRYRVRGLGATARGLQ